MEKELKIAASGNKFIYGVLRGALRGPLIVFVHGLCGDKNEHQFFNGARFFQKHGFSSFRFNLYGWQKDARKLHQCTLETHARDLDRAVDYFRKKGVKKIFVVGHSYGGSTILVSEKKDFNAVVLWDSSHRSSRLLAKARYLKKFDGYLEFEEAAYGFLVGKAMVEQAKRSRVEEKIMDIHVPIKIIVAGRGVLAKGGEWYYRHANKPKAFTIILGADHTFDEDGAEEKLFKETLIWFKKFK